MLPGSRWDGCKGPAQRDDWHASARARRKSHQARPRRSGSEPTRRRRHGGLRGGVSPWQPSGPPRWQKPHEGHLHVLSQTTSLCGSGLVIRLRRIPVTRFASGLTGRWRPIPKRLPSNPVNPNAAVWNRRDLMCRVHTTNTSVFRNSGLISDLGDFGIWISSTLRIYSQTL